MATIKLYLEPANWTEALAPGHIPGALKGRRQTFPVWVSSASQDPGDRSVTVALIIIVQNLR